jgi:uncharacterized membrane protein required for colicin V production
VKLNLIDVVILLFLLVGAWQGFRRGLILASGKLIGFLGGIWVAARYYNAIARFLGTHLGLNKLLARALTPFTSHMATTAPALAVSGRGTLSGFPESLWIPARAVSAGIYGNNLALSLSQTIIKVIVFLVILALVGYVVMALASLLSTTAHMIMLGGADRLGGVCLGLVARVLELAVVVGLLTPVVLGLAMGQGGPLHSLYQEWNSSALIPFFNKTWNMMAPVLQNLFKMI